MRCAGLFRYNRASICTRARYFFITFRYDMKASILSGLACSVLVLAAAPSVAADAAGNAEAGRQKASMCMGCHNIPGYKTAFPSVYHVPKLNGQHAAYIAAALKAYKTGERAHPSMRGIAATLTDQDMADLGAFYAAEPAKSASR
jgi:cytochrome c553